MIFRVSRKPNVCNWRCLIADTALTNGRLAALTCNVLSWRIGHLWKKIVIKIYGVCDTKYRVFYLSEHTGIGQNDLACGHLVGTQIRHRLDGKMVEDGGCYGKGGWSKGGNGRQCKTMRNGVYWHTSYVHFGAAKRQDYGVVCTETTSNRTVTVEKSGKDAPRGLGDDNRAARTIWVLRRMALQPPGA